MARLGAGWAAPSGGEKGVGSEWSSRDTRGGRGGGKLVGGGDAVKGADAVQVFHLAAIGREIVGRLARFDIIGAEGGIKIIIEIAAMRGHPGEMPVHPFLEGQEFRQWRT